MGSVHSRMTQQTHFFFKWRLSCFGNELFIYWNWSCVQLLPVNI